MQSPLTFFPARVRRGVVVVLPLVLVALVVRRIRIAAGMRRGDQAVIDAKRARNNRLANRLVTTVGRAGRRHSIFAVIHVRGRRSGRSYATPIRLVQQGDSFIVPLTYGPRTSWYVNLSANSGELEWQGRRIPVSNPALLATRTVAHQFPPLSRFLMWLDGTDQCVRIERAPHVGQQDSLTFCQPNR